MSRGKIAGTVVLFSILGFLLNPHAPLGAALFGSPPAGGAAPSAAQTGALMLVAGIEAVAFGLGGAFLLFGLPSVRAVIPRPGAVYATWLVIVWSLVSWVPHSALHQTAGDDFAKLVAIEYAFHVTLVLGGAYLAWLMVFSARIRRAAGLAPDGPRGPRSLPE